MATEALRLSRDDVRDVWLACQQDAYKAKETTAARYENGIFIPAVIGGPARNLYWDAGLVLMNQLEDRFGDRFFSQEQVGCGCWLHTHQQARDANGLSIKIATLPLQRRGSNQV